MQLSGLGHGSLAARIVVRVTDGLSLQEAMKRSFAEAYQHQRLGAIGIDATGAIAWGKTSEVLAAFHARRNGRHTRSHC